jgi:hypothetical protein
MHHNGPMQNPLLNIPPGVIDWVRDVFLAVNTRSASTLSRIPQIWIIGGIATAIWLPWHSSVK